MDEIRRALLGDEEAQQAVTERGELLPCPFCGSEKAIISNWGMWRGWCQACLGKSDDQLSYRDALRMWNTRPQLLTDEEMARLGKDTNVPTKQATINREAWGPCGNCKTCENCQHSGDYDPYEGYFGECGSCDVKMHSNFSPVHFCHDCGRPLTEEAWAALEKRLRG